MEKVVKKIIRQSNLSFFFCLITQFNAAYNFFFFVYRRPLHPVIPITASSDDSRELGQPYSTYGSKKTFSDDSEAPER